jgi:DNA-binding CsgD family transcriptional regulator
MYTAAIRLVGRTVDAELACWATIDPETLVISTMVSGDNRIDPAYEPRLAESEYAIPDEPHTFAALARRGSPMAKLSDLPDNERRRSTRLNAVWRPLGLDREVRVPFLADGACWGAAALVRAGGDFTDRETEYLVAVAPALARATRVAVRAEAADVDPAGRPAIAVIGADGALRSATAAAREWQEALDEIAPGRFLLMMQVMASGASRAISGTFRARLRDARGRWAVCRASPLIDSSDDDEAYAVVLEPTTGDQLVSLLLVAYGLTARERDVCREVMAGHSTMDIAGRLFISANTVQDHLKSVFSKVGVRSRGELVARLRPEP